MARRNDGAVAGGRGVSRRGLLRSGATGAAGLAVFALACGGDNKSDNQGGASTATGGAARATPGSTTQAGGDVVRGGTFRYVVPYNITSLDPAYSASANDPTVYRLVYDTLFAFDEKGSLLPYLTDKWEVTDDGLQWTLHLHPNVKFHDGTPFNAEAAKFNIDRILNPDNKSPQRTELAPIASTQAPDAGTVVIKLNAPYSPLGYLLAGRSGTIYSPAAVQKYGADTRTNPVGTGPFKFEEYLSDAHFNATKNPEYWKIGADGKPLPYYDSVRVAINTDPTASLALLRSGQADMLHTVDIDTAQQLKNDSNLQVLKGRSLPSGLSMNTNRRDKPSLFSDVRLRQAVALSIDPAAVVKVAQAGDGVVSPPQNFWYPEHWAWYTDQFTIKRDLQQAKQLMAAAGQPNGFEFNYIYIKGVSTRAFEIMQANLMEVGIKMNLEVLEVGVYSDRNQKGEWEAGGSAGNILTVDPGPSLRRYFVSESGCAGPRGVFSGSGFNNCEFDQLIAKGEATADQNERKKIYQRLNELWAQPWHSNKLWIAPSYTAARKNVRNAALFPDGVPQFHEAWLAK